MTTQKFTHTQPYLEAFLLFALALEVEVDDDRFLPSVSASFSISMRNILEHLPYSQLVASVLRGKVRLILGENGMGRLKKRWWRVGLEVQKEGRRE